MEKNENKAITRKTMIKKASTKKEEELSELKKELVKKDNDIEALKKDMEQLKSLILRQNVLKNMNNATIVQDDKEDVDTPLATNELISVISLVNNVLILTTEAFGKGTPYIFHEFGEQQPIIYGDLIKIIHNQRGFATDGHFFIANKKFVRTNGLERYYKKIINPKKLMDIFSLPKDEVEDIFKNSANTIKESIVGILVNKMTRGENIDGNVLYGIQKYYDRDITKMVKDKRVLIEYTK